MSKQFKEEPGSIGRAMKQCITLNQRWRMSSRDGMNARGREDSGGEGGRKKSEWRRNEGRR